MRKLLPGIGAIIASLGFSLWALPRLPAQVPTHWGLDGQPNGWSSPVAAALLLPAIALAVALVLVVAPRIDPRRASYELHGPAYALIGIAVLVLLALSQVAVIGSAIGWNVRMATVVPIGVGALFLVIGNVMPRLRPNWFVGIRTPWTLSSESVWRRTHRVGGYAFLAAGVLLIVVGAAAPGRLLAALIIAGVIAGVVPVGYSYYLWRGEREEARP